MAGAQVSLGSCASSLNQRWAITKSQKDDAQRFALCFSTFSSPDRSWIHNVRQLKPCQKCPLGPSDDSTFESNKAICLFSTLLLYISQTIHLSTKLLFLKLLAFTSLAQTEAACRVLWSSWDITTNHEQIFWCTYICLSNNMTADSLHFLQVS